ncbi:MAG: RNA-binding cell elongation regulator Jag/EloR [Desulfobacter sp.]
MKETQEFTGKDVDTAVANACTALGLSKSNLDYEVISAGTSGIFGIVGRKDARIKVSLPAEESGNASDEDMEGILSIVDEAFGEETRLEGSPAPQKAKAPKEEKDTQEECDTAAYETEEAEETDSRNADEDNGRWDTKPAKRQRPQIDQEDVPPPVDVTQESIDLGKEALQKMADLITDDAHIEAITDQDHLTLQITGGNAGILIGRKGQTLDAMQFLVDKIINRKSEARVRVRVDIEGYMETRKTNLKQLAYKMAEKAKKTGRPATINQMSAQDRRIVHLALKDDNQVRTQSMGDGYYRRLVIFPKKKNAYRGKKRSRR